MKKLLIVIGILGFFIVCLGAGGADHEVADKLWMAAAIIGMLLVILSRLLYKYIDWMYTERAKKTRHYRKYLELQKKMSA